jgi:NitT/TauT family transport system substrate-binding protein
MRAFVSCAIGAARETIANPAGAIASLKKYNPLIDEKLELDALDFSNNKAVLTDEVKRNGISSFSSERLDELLARLSDALGIPKPAGSDVWTSAYLPPREGLKLQ